MFYIPLSSFIMSHNVTERWSNAWEPAAEDGGGDQREQVHRHPETAEGDVLQEEDRRESLEGHQPPGPGAERHRRREWVANAATFASWFFDSPKLKFPWLFRQSNTKITKYWFTKVVSDYVLFIFLRFDHHA